MKRTIATVTGYADTLRRGVHHHHRQLHGVALTAEAAHLTHLVGFEHLSFGSGTFALAGILVLIIKLAEGG